jgi:hypothetical protein
MESKEEKMAIHEIIFILIFVAAAIAALLFFLNRKANKKMAQHQMIIDQNKMVQSIFIIDKKKDKIANVNMPKAITEQMPKIMKLRKLYFVKAKIGPQIMTFMTEKKVYNELPVKKNIKVELVGIYIMGIASGKQKTDSNVKMVEARRGNNENSFKRRYGKGL